MTRKRWNMQTFNDFINRRFRLIYFGILLCATALYLAFSFGNYVWIDEAYSLAMIQRSFSEIWSITAADVHPPLYYFALKLFCGLFRNSLWSAKLFSVIPYVFVLAFGGWELGKLFQKTTGLWFMILFFCFPYAMPFSIEIRMYSLAAAFVLGNAVFAYKAYLDPKPVNWCAFAFFGTAAAYTHYFAFVSIIFVYAFLLFSILLKKKTAWKQWLLAFGASVLLYAPWLRSFIAQLIVKVNNEYWIAPITLGTVAEYARDLFNVVEIKHFPVFFAGTYLLAFLYVIFSRSVSHRAEALLCLAVPIGTVAVGVAASILVRPVFVIKYVVPAIPLMVCFFAIALGEMEDKFLLGSLVTVALLGGVVQYRMYLSGEYLTKNYAPVQEYSEAECYIPIDDSCHMPYTLAYYVTDKPIYYGGNPGPEIPWTNLHSIEDFRMEDVDAFIVLTAAGKTVPEEYLAEYECESIGKWKVEDEADAYLLTRREK